MCPAERRKPPALRRGWRGSGQRRHGVKAGSWGGDGGAPPRSRCLNRANLGFLPKNPPVLRQQNGREEDKRVLQTHVKQGRGSCGDGPPGPRPVQQGGGSNSNAFSGFLPDGERAKEETRNSLPATSRRPESCRQRENGFGQGQHRPLLAPLPPWATRSQQWATSPGALGQAHSRLSGLPPASGICPAWWHWPVASWCSWWRAACGAAAPGGPGRGAPAPCSASSVPARSPARRWCRR